MFVAFIAGVCYLIHALKNKELVQEIPKVINSVLIDRDITDNN
jgi:hypothetical protein